MSLLTELDLRMAGKAITMPALRAWERLAFWNRSPQRKRRPFVGSVLICNSRSAAVSQTSRSNVAGHGRVKPTGATERSARLRLVLSHTAALRRIRTLPNQPVCHASWGLAPDNRSLQMAAGRLMQQCFCNAARFVYSCFYPVGGSFGLKTQKTGVFGAKWDGFSLAFKLL